MLASVRRAIVVVLTMVALIASLLVIAVPLPWPLMLAVLVAAIPAIGILSFRVEDRVHARRKVNVSVD